MRNSALEIFGCGELIAVCSQLGEFRVRIRCDLGMALSYLGLEWHGQVHAGKLQSLCRTSHVAFRLQKEEIIGGQTPRG